MTYTSPSKVARMDAERHGAIILLSKSTYYSGGWEDPLVDWASSPEDLRRGVMDKILENTYHIPGWILDLFWTTLIVNSMDYLSKKTGRDRNTAVRLMYYIVVAGHSPHCSVQLDEIEAGLRDCKGLPKDLTAKVRAVFRRGPSLEGIVVKGIGGNQPCTATLGEFMDLHKIRAALNPMGSQVT